MPLQLDSLRQSLNVLVEVLAVSGNDERMGQLTDIERVAIRAGVVRYFEITYELCWKLVARWLNSNISPGIASGISRRHLFRLAAESSLITDVERWMRHHQGRNATSHVYDLKKAEAVYLAAVDFAHDASSLLSILEARND